MTLSNQATREIVARLIRSQDYRSVVLDLMNRDFLQSAVAFFKKVAEAKLDAKEITLDWYKRVFLNERLPKNEIAMNAGLNMKSVHNAYRSSTKSIVIDAAGKNFDSLCNKITDLMDSDEAFDLTLTIKMRGVSVELNVRESLIVINALAIMRAAMRGGYWSAAGKGAEKPLLVTLCKLFGVPDANYDSSHFVRQKGRSVDREVDFYLKPPTGGYVRCEVKLMGSGNSESADVIFARDTNIFVGDTLSAQNRAQCDQLGVCWIALRDTDGFRRFALALDKYEIPYANKHPSIDDLDRVLDEVLGK